MEGQEMGVSNEKLAEKYLELKDRLQDIGVRPEEPQHPNRTKILVTRVKNGFRIETWDPCGGSVEYVAYVMADVLTIVEAVIRRVELPL